MRYRLYEFAPQDWRTPLVVKLILIAVVSIVAIESLVRKFVTERMSFEWSRLHEMILNDQFARNPHLYDFSVFVIDGDDDRENKQQKRNQN